MEEKKEAPATSLQATGANTFHDHKGNVFYRHLQIDEVERAFNFRPPTMLECAYQTGIERANICRYVAELEKQGEIALVRKGLCPITGYRAGFYTTNKSLFPNIQQSINI
jgi:hypothetical protein